MHQLNKRVKLVKAKGSSNNCKIRDPGDFRQLIWATDPPNPHLEYSVPATQIHVNSTYQKFYKSTIFDGHYVACV